MRPQHPRAVIDTNVLLDFWVFDDAAARPLRAAVEDGQVNALRSGDSVDEFTHNRDKLSIVPCVIRRL